MKEVYNIISHELTHCNVYNNSINNTANYGSGVCWLGDNGTLSTCNFINLPNKNTHKLKT